MPADILDIAWCQRKPQWFKIWKDAFSNHFSRQCNCDLGENQLRFLPERIGGGFGRYCTFPLSVHELVPWFGGDQESSSSSEIWAWRRTNWSTYLQYFSCWRLRSYQVSKGKVRVLSEPTQAWSSPSGLLHVDPCWSMLVLGMEWLRIGTYALIGT